MKNFKIQLISFLALSIEIKKNFKRFFWKIDLIYFSKTDDFFKIKYILFFIKKKIMSNLEKLNFMRNLWVLINLKNNLQKFLKNPKFYLKEIQKLTNRGNFEFVYNGARKKELSRIYLFKIINLKFMCQN